MIKMPLNINLEKKKIPRTHLTIHHQIFRYYFSEHLSLSMTLNLTFPFLIPLGAAFTLSFWETQGRLPVDTGTILELTHKYILHVSDNYFV